MHLCHIVSHIDEEASGPAYSVPRLAQAVAAAGHDVTLATLDRGGGSQDFAGITHRAFPQAGFPKRLGRSAPMSRWLRRSARDGDLSLIHSHGLWMMPNIYPAQAVRGTKVAHVMAPRGTLDPAALAYSARVKRVVWHMGQRRALAEATALHATSEAEAADIRAQGLRQPIFLSPNGIDIPDLHPAGAPNGSRTLLYLGRLHDKKGIDMLLTAWEPLSAEFEDWTLRIVGKGSDGFVSDLKNRAAALPRVSVEGPLYDAAKTQAMADADLFVLPTRGENFGMVVAEALAAGTPVLTTRGAPWSGLTTENCGWWVNPDVPSITDGLRAALAYGNEDLAAKGARGRDWMARAFGWQAIGAAMSDCYEWLLHGGARPGSVLTE